MKTAKKVIDDRLTILDSFLEQTNDNTEAAVQMNRGNALHAKGLFNQLKVAIGEYGSGIVTDYMPVNVIDEVKEKIKELAGMTMVPLVERNKQVIEHYKQMIYNLHQRSNDIKNHGDLSLDANGPLREELNNVWMKINQYEKINKDTLEYLIEYETALEEIKDLVTEKETNIIAQEEIITSINSNEQGTVTGNLLYETNEHINSNTETPKNPENNGEFPD